jgi:flagellin
MAAFSVNTNAGALIALQSLNKTSKQLAVVQNRINTGLKVSSAKDNAAFFNIAQNLRADVAGLNAAKQSIDRALGAVDVAVAAAESVSDILISLKEKAVAAKDPSIDTATRTALNDDFVSIRNSITNIVDNAEFNGTNAVVADDIVAILNDDASATLTIAAQGLSLGGSIIDVTATEVVSSAAAASTALDNIEASITQLGAALSAFGAGGKSLERQQEFLTKLSDTIEIGISNIVDADLAKESANLQSLQVKQQLGVQALAIANQQPTVLLSLFG